MAFGIWYVEQLFEYDVGRHYLPRDLRRRRTKHQKAVEAWGLLLCSLCPPIMRARNVLHLLESNFDQSSVYFMSMKFPCPSMLRVSLCF